MITVLGSPRRCCDGITRRETLKVGALSLLGGFFSLPNLLALEEKSRPLHRPGKARSVILLYLLAGAATQDMFDLKPEAPSGIRSEFRPVATHVPGIRICEHLPRMAQWMHRAALVRSVNHKAGCHNCLPTKCRRPISIRATPIRPAWARSANISSAATTTCPLMFTCRAGPHQRPRHHQEGPPADRRA